jgi:hypothetical protein
VQEQHAAAAGRLWLEKKPAPLNPRDVVIFAEALAEAGSDEALTFIERMRASNAGEAATLAAVLRYRQGQIAMCPPLLLAAFTAYRTDAWPSRRVQLRAFELTMEITRRQPKAAPLLLAALAKPLPGFLMESARRQTLTQLTLRQWESGQPVDASGFALLEPWPTWTRDYLKSRYAFYRATGLGDAGRARADLELFLSADVTPFNRGLETPEAASGTPEAPVHGIGQR